MRQSLRTNQKRSGYTLVELIVTLSIITLIGAAGLPQLANNSDRARLDSAANNIRQIILNARTLSLAPGGGEHANKQVFEVRMGDFQGVDTARATASGSSRTNLVETFVGVASCGEDNQIAQKELIRDYHLPRGIYISAFYPTNNFVGQNEVLIRFSVGRLGFVCGAADSSLFNSTNFGGWTAVDEETSQSVFAKYLIVELSSTRSHQKKYIAVDRQTAEVFVSSSDPQRYLDPTNDLFSPQWSSDPLNIPTFARMTTTCFTNSSEVVLSFKRAKDRVGSVALDFNQAVYYDISWSLINDPTRFEPLVLRYYYDVSSDSVEFRFMTDQITIPNQPGQVFFRIVARDSVGNLQRETEPSALNRPAAISFAPNCGTRPVEEDDLPDQSIDQYNIEPCENVSTSEETTGRPRPCLVQATPDLQ